MKNMKNIAFALIVSAAAVLTACDDQWMPDYLEKGGDIEAVIGFEQATYTYKESAGTVKLPVKILNLSDEVTVEQIKYPIYFDVQATVTDNSGKEMSELYTFIQDKDLRLTSLNTTVLEMTIVDNEEENDDVTTRLEIVNVRGAQVSDSAGACTIVVADNDKNPYEKLQGNWKVTAKSYKDGSSVEWTCSIVGGAEAAGDIEENFEKTLIMWGYHGYKYDYSAYYPSETAYPYCVIVKMAYDEESKTISLKGGEFMTDVMNFGLGDTQLVYSAILMKDETGATAFYKKASIAGTWSDDFNTITFDPEGILGAVVYTGTMPSNTSKCSDDAAYAGYWYTDYQIEMTRVR